MNTKKILIALAMTLLMITVAGAQTRIVGLTVDYQTTPLGLDNQTPLLGWRMESDKYGSAQTAYRVVAALSEAQLAGGDYCYDSGRTASDKSVAIPYGGALMPTTRYHWRVFVWEDAGRMVTSEPTWFETGLMKTGCENSAPAR